MTSFNEKVPQEETGSTPVQFKRAMGLADATAVVVGSMIGSGIFIVSAETARNVGSPGILLLCWLLGGLLTIIGAVCYSELAAMYPHAGGQYVFLREAYGPLFAFLYGWTLFTVIQSGTIAAVAVGFAKFLGVFLPWVSNTNILFSLGSWNLTTLQIVAVLLICLLTYINCRGIEAAKFVQTTFTSTKVFALAAIIILGFLSFGKYHGIAPNFGDIGNFFSGHDLKGNPIAGLDLLLVIGFAMVGALFSCDAWNNITFAGEEVKNPESTLPKSLFLGTVCVVVLYLLANIVYLLLLPLHGNPDGATAIERGIQFAREDRVGTAAAEVIFGESGLWIMAGAILISTFGCLNGLILAGARVYYAMAKDGLFFSKAAVLDSKSCVPIFGLLIQGGWSVFLATSGTYSQLLEYVVFAALLFYVLTVGAVIMLRRKFPEKERPFRIPAFPLLPILYIVAAVAVMSGQIFGAMKTAGAGLLIILSGLPAYYLWKSRTKQG